MGWGAMPASVLIVDHKQVSRAVMRAVLESAGLSVEMAAGARIGLERLWGGRFDLAIVELCMPEMDGMEFLIHARSLPSRPPILTMCRSERVSRDALLRDSQLLGAAGVVTDPLHPPTLMASVRSVLSEPTRTPAAYPR